jgi:hypothetical protein
MVLGLTMTLGLVGHETDLTQPRLASVTTRHTLIMTLVVTRALLMFRYQT